MKLIKTSDPAIEKLDDHVRQLVYCGLDTLLTCEVEESLKNRMDDSATATYDFERKQLGPIMTIVQRGMLIDLPERDRVCSELSKKVEVIEKNLKDLVSAVWDNPEFNYKSYLQMQTLFYEKLFVPKEPTVKKGQVKYSLDRAALERLEREYTRAIPFAKAILAIRDEQKVIDALTSELSEDNRWKASFNIGGTDTGRLSSSEHPLRIGGNLQNIDDFVRRCFIADPGYVLFSFDQQGAEARLVAYLSGDEGYIKALEAGDVHTIVASMVFGFEPKKELAERKYYRDMSYRDIAKRAAHGSNYGGSARTIAKVLKVETAVIEEFQAKYFRTFPGIVRWQEWVARQIQTKGYIDTPFGRRRYFWGRTWDDTTIRAAIAYTPQSTVGDLTQIGAHKLWANYEPELQLLNNVHDANIGQVLLKELDVWMPRIVSTLETPMPITDINGVTRTIVIPWEGSVGFNWGKRIVKKDGTIENPRGLRAYGPTALADLERL